MPNCRRLQQIGLSTGAILLLLSEGTLAQQGPPQPPSGFEGALAKILQFLYTIAHWLGGVVAEVIQTIFPSITMPSSLIDTIGFLVVITVLMAIVDVAKKFAWVIVVIGWLLVIVRIGMLVF